MRAHQPTSEPLGAVEGRCKTKGPHWACTHQPLPVLGASWQCSRLAAQIASRSSWAQVLSIMAKWEGWTSCHSWSLRSAVSFGNWGSFQDFHSLAPSLTLRCKAACGFHGTAQVADRSTRASRLLLTTPKSSSAPWLHVASPVATIRPRIT